MKINLATATAEAIPFTDAPPDDEDDFPRSRDTWHPAPDPLARRAAPATCGELVQGALDGRDFLVNCPIDRFASAAVRRTDRVGLHVHRPERFAKVRAALALLDPPVCGRAGHDGLEVELGGDLPRGKGMASSSAELAAALATVSAALGRPLHPAMLSGLIARIEPSDSVHLPGWACTA